MLSPTLLVSVIIVNWNGLRCLSDCFSSLYQQDYANFEVIFVDNGSEDGSVEWVKTNYPDTSLILNTSNLGYSEANNMGYDASKGDYVLFLNNDTRVTKTFLTELVRVIERDRSIGGAQSKILLMDKPNTYDTIGAFLTPTGFLYHYGFGERDQAIYDKEIDLYTAKGACMMFRRDVLETISIEGKILDPDYFAYFEESDMCHRVWLAGYRVVYAYNAVIFHKMSATSDKMHNAFVQYHSFKNRIRTYLKNLSTYRLLTILPLHIFLCEGISLISLLRGRIALAIGIQKAMIWNVAHLHRTLILRRDIQNRVRKTSDTAIMKSVLYRPSVRYYLNLYRRVAI